MIVNVINTSNNNLPKYETSLSAGMDVRADFSKITPENTIKAFGDCEVLFKSEANKVTMIRLDPGARALIPTGIFMQMPEGDGSFRYECQVRPRSGLALKKGITVLNTPGTIDADYINEIGIILINNGYEAVYIEDGERLAQLVFTKVEVCKWNEVDSLKETTRKGGFGSTGK